MRFRRERHKIERERRGSVRCTTIPSVMGGLRGFIILEAVLKPTSNVPTRRFSLHKIKCSSDLYEGNGDKSQAKLLGFRCTMRKRDFLNQNDVVLSLHNIF